VRQLLHMWQTGGVADYVECFTGLVDQLAAYESHPDPLHYTMRFIDGLRDVKATVLIRWPSDLDTAYVLAQLQEVTPTQRRRKFKRNEFSYSHKQDAPLPQTLPLPPRVDKPAADDKRTIDTGSSRSVVDRW